jgi:Uma2 family endonuclease
MRHTPAVSSVARKRLYTWDDFIALPDDDRRELIDGELVEVEVPNMAHEKAVVEIATALERYAERRGGLVLGSGFKIRVSAHRGAMPDVQMYSAGNEPSIDQMQGLVRGRPDLVVEILSPGSRRYDRMIKLRYYASLEIPEYWIVDVDARLLEQLVFSEDGYVIAATYERGEVVTSSKFRGLQVRLARIWLDAAPANKRRPIRKRRP